MTALRTAPDARFVGLSCYTSNLACYLAAEFAEAEELLARSIRLAVRTDLSGGRLAFSHHRYPLDRLPDGSRLRWACGDAADAAAELRGELRRHGAILVLTDIAALPWSPSYRSGAAAPHLLLVDGRRNDAWHVVDAFSGLLATGEQEPHAGWMTADMLLAAMAPSDRWSAVQHNRNGLAFGFTVPVPCGDRLRWLRRDAAGTAGRALRGDWLLDDARALPFLAGYVVAQGARAEQHLDDIWTAARHRAFRHRWRRGAPGLRDGDRERLEAAAQAWERLPQALRFAVDSARRGRPRESLVHTTFSHLLAQELALGSTDSPPVVPVRHSPHTRSPEGTPDAHAHAL